MFCTTRIVQKEITVKNQCILLLFGYTLTRKSSRSLWGHRSTKQTRGAMDGLAILSPQTAPHPPVQGVTPLFPRWAAEGRWELRQSWSKLRKLQTAKTLFLPQKLLSSRRSFPHLEQHPSPCALVTAHACFPFCFVWVWTLLHMSPETF